MDTGRDELKNDLMPNEQEIIETSMGRIWVTDTDSGDLRVWWPHGARVGDLAMTVLEGRARWNPKGHCWYVPAKSRDEIYAALCDL